MYRNRLASSVPFTLTKHVQLNRVVKVKCLTDTENWNAGFHSEFK